MFRLGNKNGAPLCGAPLFLALFWLAGFPGLACAQPPAADGTTLTAIKLVASPAGNTLSPAAGGTTLTAAKAVASPAANTPVANRVIVTADQLVYNEETGSVSAEGHVKIWYGDITLTSQSADADVVARRLYAEGDVKLLEAGKEINCARMTYDMQTASARAEGIVFAAFPWYYQGTRVEKQGDKRVLITEPNFTTCNSRHPHYHLTASRIDILLGESLTAYDTVLYVGATPLFYLPWFQRSLKDQRPPFSIRAGYNDSEGLWVRTLFNYYLLEKNYGTLTLDFMQRKGVGFGWDQFLDYQLAGKGNGGISAFYVQDKFNGQERWNFKAEDRHEIDSQDQLQLRAEYISDKNFNQDFYSSLVDSYQQQTYLAYSRHTDAYYLNLIVQDTETIDPLTGHYASTLRQLPGFDFSLSSFKVAQVVTPVYFNFNSSFTRSFERVDALGNSIDSSGNTLSAALVTTYRFRDTANLTSSLTQTFASPRWFPTQPALSWSLSLPATGYVRESLVDPLEIPARMDVGYTTTVTLVNKWVNYLYTKTTQLVQTRISHSFSRRLAHLDEPGVLNAGVSDDHMGLGADYFAGSVFRLQADTAYAFLPQPAFNYLGQTLAPQYWNPLNLTSSVMLGSALSLNAQGQYNWYKGKVTNSYASANTSGTNWTLAFSGSYSYQENLLSLPGFRDYALYGTVSGTYRMPKAGMAWQASVQYDFAQQRVNNFSVTMSHDLHCWEMQAGLTHYFDPTNPILGRNDIGIGIALKAFPNVQVGMPGGGGMSTGQ